MVYRGKSQVSGQYLFAPLLAQKVPEQGSYDVFAVLILVLLTVAALGIRSKRLREFESKRRVQRFGVRGACAVSESGGVETCSALGDHK